MVFSIIVCSIIPIMWSELLLVGLASKNILAKLLLSTYMYMSEMPTALPTDKILLMFANELWNVQQECVCLRRADKFSVTYGCWHHDILQFSSQRIWQIFLQSCEVRKIFFCSFPVSLAIMFSHPFTNQTICTAFVNKLLIAHFPFSIFKQSNFEPNADRLFVFGINWCIAS